MGVFWGVLIVVVSLPCWAGQVISWIAPDVAERWGLTESAQSVDATFHADARGEAVWDSLTLWTMPVAGILLAGGLDAWAFFGLFAGGMYLYFGGRGVFTRRTITRRGGRVGEPSYLPVAFGALGVWGLMGLAVAVAAIVALNGS